MTLYTLLSLPQLKTCWDKLQQGASVNKFLWMPAFAGMARIAYFFWFLFILYLSFPITVFAQEKILNIYGWTGELPEFLVRQFEIETGIKVNLSVYGSNEIMYAKLRATKSATYDIVMPSSYFVDRMSHLDMLEQLDKTKLSNWKNLNPTFLHPAYDPNTNFSVPYIWGTTGIFFNTTDRATKHLTKWADFWEPRFADKLMLLDDSREIFSMALLMLGYSSNDKNPEHIKEAFLKLKTLMKNVKLFSSETVISILIDEDATVGMVWNGDLYKAAKENAHLKFVYPKEGFVIWVDNFSIPKNAPHKEAAYAFINFMLRPDVAKAAALYINYATTNLAAQQLLPPGIRNNPTIYPPKNILRRGQFQTDLGEEPLALIEKYWEELKISG